MVFQLLAAATEGKVPHEVEAAAAAAAAAELQAAATAALSDIPEVSAPWEEVEQFMTRVARDIQHDNMEGWLVNNMHRGRYVFDMCPRWRFGKSQQQQAAINKFQNELRSKLENF